MLYQCVLGGIVEKECMKTSNEELLHNVYMYIVCTRALSTLLHTTTILYCTLLHTMCILQCPHHYVLCVNEVRLEP